MTHAEVGEVQGLEPSGAGGLRKLGKVRNGFFPRAPRRNTALPTYFRRLTFRTVR